MTSEKVCSKCRALVPASGFGRSSRARDGLQSWCDNCKNKARRKFAPGEFAALIAARKGKRFWSKVDKRGPDECWEWTGARFPNGYGGIGIGRRRTEYAHRMSFEMHVGPVPTGLFVCHRCDNPPCVNPAHLYAGTAADNSHDCHSRGRHPSTKLTIAQRSEIRAKRAAGAKLSVLAKEYGICESRVSSISREASE